MTTATQTKIRPQAGRVVLRVDDPDEVTPGGIVLPEAAQDKQQCGTVVAVGPGRILESGARASLELAVGERVVFTQYGGVEIEVNGEKLLVVSIDDVLVVV